MELQNYSQSTFLLFMRNSEQKLRSKCQNSDSLAYRKTKFNNSQEFFYFILNIFSSSGTYSNFMYIRHISKHEIVLTFEKEFLWYSFREEMNCVFSDSLNEFLWKEYKFNGFECWNLWMEVEFEYVNGVDLLESCQSSRL